LCNPTKNDWFAFYESNRGRTIAEVEAETKEAIAKGWPHDRQAQKSLQGRLQRFVPLLIETLDCPAWKVMSMSARLLYAALKRRYGVNIHNNRRLFVSRRDAAEEIGSHKDGTMVS
jgi:hypothetical protein